MECTTPKPALPQPTLSDDVTDSPRSLQRPNLPLIRLTARLADGTRVSVWRAWPSTWAAMAYATDVLAAVYASARVMQPAKVPA